MGGYERWKNGEKVTKASWVIDYYKSVTDYNQFKKGRISHHRALLIICPFCSIFGFVIGIIICSL